MRGVPCGGLPSVDALITYTSETSKPAVPLALIQEKRRQHGSGTGESGYLAEVSLLERSGVYVGRDMRLHNARSIAPTLTLGEHAIALCSHPPPIPDLADEAALRRAYYPAMVELLTELTGASRSVVLDHKLRGVEQQTWGGGFHVGFAHSDMTTYVEWDGGAAPGAPWPVTAGRHFAVYNVWRPLDPWPVQDQHLALLDPATVGRDDVILWETQGGADKNCSLRVAHSDRHRWMYFPRMTNGEVLVFKQYDTREPDASQRQVFHTAFSDPTRPDGLPKRRSVEIRVLCIFGADEDPTRRERFAAEFPAKSALWRGLDLPYHWHTQDGTHVPGGTGPPAAKM